MRALIYNPTINIFTQSLLILKNVSINLYKTFKFSM